MMGDKKGETIKKQPQSHSQQQQQQQQQQAQSSFPKDPLDESTSSDQVIIRPTPLHHHHQQPAPPPPPPTVVVAGGGGPTPSFISTPLFVPIAAAAAAGTATSTSSSFDPQFETPATTPTVNPKRPRYGGTAQWKLLPSPSSQQKQTLQVITTESSPSPTTNLQTQQQQITATASSSDTTTSSPSHSPIPTASGGKETSRSIGEGGDHNHPLQLQHHHQFRKGKYVSPVWKPNEMLWLARAWRVQYQGAGGSSSDAESGGGGAHIAAGESTAATPTTRGKTRADKDREVAEYLNRHGVSRDAKTAGTKWDNMLGEFRKVYEWERGGEREQVGKSYFRLSPYERKIHRLPASFDEEVFEELSQFMGSRMRSSSSSSHHHHHHQNRGIMNIISSSTAAPSSGDNIVEHVSSSSRSVLARSLPPPPPPPNFKEDDLISISARAKQLVMATTGSGDQGYNFHGGGGGGGGRGSLLGFDPTSSMLMEHNMNNSNNVVLVGASSNTSPNLKEMRRIGKIRMTWEESVSLWGEEGEHHRGRVKLQGSSFLNADELTFFDDSMVACTMEAFEDGVFKGFSVDKFVSGQQLKVFGRRKSSLSPSPAMATTTSTTTTTTTPPPPSSASGFIERVQLPLTDHPSMRSIPPFEFQDPTEYYVGCLRVPPSALPTLFELSWYLQEPPPEELRFPLRRDVYRDLPQGKDLFFTTSNELLDCRGITYDILSPIIRPNPSISGATSSSRDSFIGVWDDCINRVVSKFCSVEVVLVRKPSTLTTADSGNNSTTIMQDQWPNVAGFVRNFCLWRGEETDVSREGEVDPSTSIVEKLLWTYMDLPYILGYYAVGYLITFCALSRSQDRIHRSDLYSLDLSSPSERLKALVPCYRIAGLLLLLADRCFNNVNSTIKQLTFSDFERVDLGYGNVVEMTPNTVTRFYSSRRRWSAVKEIYDIFDHRIPHAEYICGSSERDLSLVFKPRGVRFKPVSCEQLVEALKYVTKALVALHDLSFMHRDLSWEKVMRRADREAEWFVSGFEEAVVAPQLYPHGNAAAGPPSSSSSGEARGRHAPEMGRAGMHGVKVDVWGVGHLLKTSGLVVGPNNKMLRELQNRCLDVNPEVRPTAADCYHHLLQVQSSLSLQSSSSGGPSMLRDFD